jgi:hypothetical protein
MLAVVLDPDRTWWSAIDHGAGKLSKRAAGMMKARGVRAGMPDFLILSYWHMAFGIELKTDKGRLSAPQRELHETWQRFHHPVFVARSLEDVQAILDERNVPVRNRMIFFGDRDGRPEGAPRPRHPGTRRRRKPKNHLPVLQRRSAQA